jgi:hypothetical protein
MLRNLHLQPSRSWFWVLIIAICAVPLISPTIPPLTDLPGHMGAYQVELSLASSSILQRFYSFKWGLVGNLGVEILILPMAALAGLELAIKLIVIGIVIITSAGMLLVSREAHGRIQTTALFALPLAYCYPFLFGFVNFCLTMGLSLIALAIWMRLGSTGCIRWRASLFAIIAPALWLSHAEGWFLFCLMCGGTELARIVALRGLSLKTLAQTGLACLPLATALPLVLLQQNGTATEFLNWMDVSSLAKWSIGLFRDRWAYIDMLCAAVAVALVLLAVTRRFGLRVEAVLFYPAAFLLIASMLLPDRLNGAGYVSSRIIPYVAILAILSVRYSSEKSLRRTLFVVASVLFFVLRMTAVTASTYLYSRSYNDQLGAVEHIPLGSTVATFWPQPCASGLSVWKTDRLGHLSGIALSRRLSFVNSEWATPGLQLLRAKLPDVSPFDRDPSEIVTISDCPSAGYRSIEKALDDLPWQQFDYLWLVGVPRQNWPRRPWLQPVWTIEDGFLAKIDRKGVTG